MKNAALWETRDGFEELIVVCLKPEIALTATSSTLGWDVGTVELSGRQ